MFDIIETNVGYKVINICNNECYLHTDNLNNAIVCLENLKN